MRKLKSTKKRGIVIGSIILLMVAAGLFCVTYFLREEEKLNLSEVIGPVWFPFVHIYIGLALMVAIITFLVVLLNEFKFPKGLKGKFVIIPIVLLVGAGPFCAAYFFRELLAEHVMLLIYIGVTLIVISIPFVVVQFKKILKDSKRRQGA